MAKKKKKGTIVTDDNFLQQQPQIKEGEEIIALVDSLEKANQIANELSITFIRFSQGVATYHTAYNPSIIVQVGRSKGYEISLNTALSLIGPVDNKITL